MLSLRYPMEYARTGCPIARRRHPDLGYYPGKRALRLYTCESCKRYLKTLDLREVGGQVCLPAERVLTLGMDAAALQAGYQASKA